MKQLGAASEATMVSAFLKAEIDSPRWGKAILDRLKMDSRSRAIVDSPDIKEAADNQYRINLLDYRGYRVRCNLFQGFPNNVIWNRVEIELADLQKLKVINLCKWPSRSCGSRLAIDAARNLSSSSEDLSGHIAEVGRLLSQGQIFPEVILVSKSLTEPCVIIEGHVRVIAAIQVNRPLTALIGLMALNCGLPSRDETEPSTGCRLG